MDAAPTPPDSAEDEVAVDLHAAKPTAASHVAHRKMRANLKAKLFGATPDPVKLGRFVILERLGEGGMGIVYVAYDPELDRKVALKILQTGAARHSLQAQERLRREAQALAQLSHPNVVAMHDVGVIDGQVFMVMEFVVGRSLRQWLGDETRSWRSVLDVYLQAGRGLAAAHKRGLVHRDFKPDNVQVGNDGRIRVLDFGLARSPTEDGDPATWETTLDQPMHRHDPDDAAALISTASLSRDRDRNGPSDGVPLQKHANDPDELRDSGDLSDSGRQSSNKLATRLTVTGAILGTPAYMSPEQHIGGRLSPASDQFSFCASLYEGLYGQRPFAGERLSKLRENVRRGRVRPVPRSTRTPNRLLPILLRGMRPIPSERYPSMDELLDDLSRDSARTRQMRLVGALIVFLSILSVYALTRGSSESEPVCEGAAAELEEVWNDRRRAELRTAFDATGHSYAARAWPRVETGLDGYGDQWVSMHRDACLAHQRGAQSGALLDARMACLARRKRAISSAATVLAEVDRTSLRSSVDVVRSLPSIDHCGHIESLLAAAPGPQEPEKARKVDELRVRLSRAKALEDAGRLAHARDLARALAVESETVGYRPLSAEVSLLQGRATMSFDRAEALPALRRAAVLAVEAGAYEIAVEALARVIYAEGTTGSPDLALSQLYLAQAMVERVPEPTFVHALLLNNAGLVQMARGDREQARASWEKALALTRSASQLPVELAFVPSNLALVTSDPAERAELMENAVVQLTSDLGEEHPKTLEMLRGQAYATTDPQAIRARLDAACELYHRYHPVLHQQQFECLYYLGFIESELGLAQSASEHLMRAAGEARNPREAWLRDLALGQGALHRGDAAGAIEALDRAIAALQGNLTLWFQKKRLADAELAKGMALLNAGDRASAVLLLEQAYARLLEVSAFNNNVDTPQRLNRTRLTLAEALWPTAGAPPAPPVRERAKNLIDQAAKWYDEGGPGYQRHRRDIERWRHQRSL